MKFILSSSRSGMVCTSKGKLEFLVPFVSTFKEQIPKISALVITGCESLDEEGRRSPIDDLRTEIITRQVVQLMHKGIFPVGFPKELVFEASKSTFTCLLFQSNPYVMKLGVWV